MEHLHHRAVCPCGYSLKTEYQKIEEIYFFFLNEFKKRLCPQCQKPICTNIQGLSGDLTFKTHWKIEPMKWVSGKIWYKPWTWSYGRWESFESTSG